MSSILPEELLLKLQRREALPECRVLAVFGEEAYYRQQLAAAVPAYIFGATPEEERELSVFERDTQLAAVAAAINTYPFFSGQSLVIIKDEKLCGGAKANENETAGASRQKQQEQLAKLLQDVPEYCTVLINVPKLDKRLKLYKALQSCALLCECVPLRTSELPRWLQRQAELYGARLEPEALQAIMSYLEPVKQAPLALLQQELAKLALYAAGRSSWTREDVEQSFSPLPEIDSFRLTDLLGRGDLQGTLEALALERKERTPLQLLYGSIRYRLNQLLRYLELRRAGCEPTALQKELGARSPYVIKNLQQQSRSFSEARLREAVLALAETSRLQRESGRDVDYGYRQLEVILLRLLS